MRPRKLNELKRILKRIYIYIYIYIVYRPHAHDPIAQQNTTHSGRVREIRIMVVHYDKCVAIHFRLSFVLFIYLYIFVYTTCPD